MRREWPRNSERKARASDTEHPCTWTTRVDGSGAPLPAQMVVEHEAVDADDRFEAPPACVVFGVAAVAEGADDVFEGVASQPLRLHAAIPWVEMLHGDVASGVPGVPGTALAGSWRPGDDLWALIFQRADCAAREAGDSDLVPHWIASGECRVERHVPLLPYAREVESFGRLKRQLAAYRVVFGQPRQQELIALLDRADFSIDQLRELTIDLSPPDAVNGRSVQ